MGTVYNIRGTNGSGKSTLARAFITDTRWTSPVDLSAYLAPTKKDPNRQLRVEGTITERMSIGPMVGVVGSYRTACGGLDGVPSFGVQQEAILYMLKMPSVNLPVPHVIAEGVLAATVFGSWADFDLALEVKGHRFAWCYLDTPLEVCLERIKRRQLIAGREREIKQDLVADKVRAIAATRAKALAAGRLVYDLPWETAEAALRRIMSGEGENFRARA